MSRGERIAAAAQALVGIRFRLQGRGEDGLDCVGVVAAALECSDEAPADYGLRGGDARRVAATLERLGLARVAGGAAKLGDVALMRPGRGQLHLAVISSGGFVHAHAGLRAVVETPGGPTWPVLGFWRAGEE